MQAERVQVLAQQAAAGNAEAFLALVHEFAPDLRLVLAAHLDQPGALMTVEPAVWTAVRGRLGEYIGDPPFASWIQHVAIDPVTTYLAQADRRAIDHQDALSHQLIEQCREALNDGGELQVAAIHARIAALPETMRTLLHRRYRDRQRTTDIAASLMISEAELATSLASVRAACDWRGLAKPPTAGDRLLPPLIEDWLNNTIDVDSRALLATNLGRDPDRAAQFARQVRVHVALGACLAPFTRDDAAALVRQTGLGAGDSGRVMMGDGPRPSATAARSITSAGSDARRPARMTTSNRQTVPLTDDAPRSSPLPWIIGGGMVVVGVVALVAMSMRTGSGRTAPQRPPESPAAVVAAPAGTSSSTTPNAPTNTGVPATGGVLRLEPGRTNAPPPPPPRVTLAVNGHLYGSQPAVLRADLSHNLGVTAVEFWKGDERVASVAEPFVWTWEKPTVGTTSFTLRAIGAAGTLSSSTPKPVTVIQGFGSGTIRREWWMGVEGFTIADGFKASGYPDRPQGEGDEPRFASPRDWNNNYLQRLRGFITPPFDGEYVFWIAGDDESQLWLSRDDKREGLQLIAVSPMIPNFGIQPQEWEHNQSQRSAGITLRRGQRYYVEVLHKDGTGEDHVAVGWRLPDGTLERPIPGAHLSPPTEPVPAAAVLTNAPLAAPTPPTGSILVLWDGETKAGGSGYASSGIAKVAGSGRDGSTGLQAVLGREVTNLGWNWHGWHPEDAGNDLRAWSAISFWLRITGANRPTTASLWFLSSPKLNQGRSAEVQLAALEPRFADGEWHQVVVPFERLAAAGFDRAKVWEFNLRLSGNGVLDATLQMDDIAALTAPPVTEPPVTTLPAPPTPPAGGVQLVRSIDFVSSGAAYVEVPARNGERVYIDREYKLVDLPPTYEIGRLIRTRNDDDGASANPHLRFTADVAVDVHLAYATTATALPAWMQGWTSTNVVVGADKGGGFRLFKRTFPAGQVVLGANERGTTNATSNYFVLVLPATQAPAAPPTWKVVRAINLGGEATEIDGVRFLSHRQAEAEGASPAGSHQPGPWLSDLNWIRGTTGVGEIRRNRSMEDKPITMDGKVYAKGLGVHANSELVYALDGRQSGFTAVVGVDDEAQSGELIFQVWLDGQKAWDSGVMRKGMVKPVAIPLAGRKELRLVVDSNGPGDWDHADWANAQFLVPGGDDGALQVQLGRRATATFTPKPAVDAKARALLSTALAGTKEGLAFRIKVPNGPSRVWVWIAENSAANSRQFDLTVEGITLPGVGLLPAGAWEKLGPIEVNLADGHIDVAATVLKGVPHVMGIVVEQQVSAASEKP